MTASRDFWVSSGHHLLDRDAAGWLMVTDEFLKAYLARPELVPPNEACAAERRLHAALLADPRRIVTSAEIAAIADADARENWQMMIAWRDHLISHETLEAAYLDIVRRSIRFPHLFIDQLVHLILRNMLEHCEDAFVVRAAELLFRPQKVRASDGFLIASDAETAPASGPHPESPLYLLLGVQTPADVELLDATNAGSYWTRSDLFDMALDLSSGQRGAAALADVMTRWISHLLTVDVAIEPLPRLDGVVFSWYVGLDAEASRIGEMLWNGEPLDDATRSHLVGLYRLTFADPTCMMEKVRGEPVYLLAATTADDMLRLKPQNLIAGLPLHYGEVVH
ncbi:MAG: hypothetical protein JWQ17_4851 [Tardiphaga sp.]|nr:hypothetical protein [Tardiphaga sp.]